MLFSGFILLEIRIVWVFIVEGSSVSKNISNDDYYQKSDYRLLQINTFLDFFICNIKGRRGFIISSACQSVK